MIDITPGVSYAFIDGSPYINHLIKKKVEHINNKAGFLSQPNMFGKQIIFSDTAEPIDLKLVVISFMDRDSLNTINVQDKFVDIINWLDGTSISQLKVNTNNDLDDEYYKLHFDSVTTYTVRQFTNIFATLVSNISTSNIEEFYNVAKHFDLQSLSNITAMAIDGTIQQYLSDYNKELPKSPKWSKHLMKISSALIQSDSLESFILGVTLVARKDDLG